MIKVYNNSHKNTCILFSIFSLYVLSSFVWDFIWNIYLVIIWFVLAIEILSIYIEKRVSKIILDLDKGEIIIFETKFFKNKNLKYSLPIDDVDCFFYKSRGPRLGFQYYFKIESKTNIVFDFNINHHGWSKKDLEDLVNQTNKYKTR
jgi:hypothetical protein